VRACCGRDFTLVVGDAATGGDLALLGADTKWRVRAAAPPRIPGWTDVAAAWGSVYVLFGSGGGDDDDDASVRSWGRNDHGQLAPAGLPAVRAIAAGSEHALALTRDAKRRLLAWGWGEHGNCGEAADERGDVKGRWNEIPLPGRRSGGSGSGNGSSADVGAAVIGAGCASSWVWVG
jgi:protein ATS1